MLRGLDPYWQRGARDPRLVSSGGSESLRILWRPVQVEEASHFGRS